MNYRFLEHQYFETRKHQMQLYEREFTQIDHEVSRIVFDTAIQAIDNVKTGNQSTCMQAVPLSTGLGKSTSAQALIATFAKHDPEFSAAYIVPTARMAEEAKKGIELLLGNDTTTLWTSYHKHKGVDTAAAKEALGHVPTIRVDKAILPTSRIVILTHGQLQHELKYEVDEGTINYLGHPRSIIFIDEQPDLVQQVYATAEQLQAFHDRVAKHDAGHPWLPVVSDVVHRMSTIMRSEGQTYTATTLLSQEEGKVFDDYLGKGLLDLTDRTASGQVRRDELADIHDLVFFLKSASIGNAFYSRYDLKFSAYKLHFNTTYSGFVLLDATCDLSGLVALHPNIRSVEVIKATYENLQIAHMDMPKKFKWANEIIKTRALGIKYGEFIKQSVLANTSAGDEVLVVLHKDILNQELIDKMEDPGNPGDWEGRKVNTQNWGSGAGTNIFRHKTHVFLFGDFVIPRPANIGQTHGWSQKPLTEESLGSANGRRKSSDVFMPQGDYLTTHEGYILRWTKQLSMRGTARQVDKHGKCFPMKLFTTLDLGTLLLNLDRLFPKAAMPVSANPPQDSPIPPYKGRQGLLRMLMNTRMAYLGADGIEAATGIKKSQLSQEFKAMEDTVKILGWRLGCAKELGFAGRMVYLINDASLGKQILKVA